MAATQGFALRRRFILLGVGGGVLGSLLVAGFADAISATAEGMGQELFTAGVLLLASAMIGWTVLWMRSHARQMVLHIKEVSAEVLAGHLSGYSLTVIIALSVLREGSEIVLFTYGMLISSQSILGVVFGAVSGALAAGALGYLLYKGIVKISTRYVFQITSWLLIMLAAGMASLSAKFLVASGKLSYLTSTLWDSSNLLPEGSIVGKILQAMVGYCDQPMAIQAVFFAAMLATLTIFMRLLDLSHKRQNAL